MHKGIGAVFSFPQLIRDFGSEVMFLALYGKHETVT
jgi:hypothetical protein